MLGVRVFSVLVFLGLMRGNALAQGWYTGNASGATAAGGTNSYAGWASATAQDGSPTPGGWGQQARQTPYAQPNSAYGYGYPGSRNAVADAAEVPRAVTWSRRPPPISPQVQYLPQPGTPMPGAWDPRVAQAPLRYATGAGQNPGGQNPGGRYGAGQYGVPSPAYPSYPSVPYPTAGYQPAPNQPVGYQPVPAQSAPNPAPAYQPIPYQPRPIQPAAYQQQPAASQPAQDTAPAGGAFAPPPLPPQGGAVAAGPEPAAPQPAAEAPTGGKLPRNEEILAYVGPDVILMGDVLPEVEHALKQALKGKTPPSDDEMDKIKIGWIRGRLKGVIEVRQVLVYVRQQFKDDESKYRDIRKQMGEAFEKKHVKTLIEQHKDKGVTCRADLEQRSVELLGGPFTRVRENFIDQTICYSFINQKLPKDEEISHADALAHYQSHEADYEFPAKARWEQITVKYSPGKHTRDEAWRIIAQCGNAIIGGARFDAIARQHSEDLLSAKNGGAQDWIGQGSLVCEKLDAALFDPRLPVGTLSPAIEDGDAFHIIRVVERRTAGKTPFAEAQKEIKEKLKKERQDEKRSEFMDTIRKQVPVRNVFEEQNPAPPPSPARPQRSDDE